MRYGYFDNEHREYVIDRVDVPVSWTNCIRGITADSRKIGTQTDTEGKVHMGCNTWADNPAGEGGKLQIMPA